MDRGVATQGATRVAIVGAGYAGMAAAASLAAKKVPVTVFEAGPLPGGRARRVNSQGIALDNGQHILVGAYTELFRMMDVVGVAPAALLRVALDVRYAEGFHFRRAALPRPFDLAAGLLTARGIALSERVSAACFMRALQRTGFQLDADIPVSELLRRHRQTGRLAQFLWQPLCVSALNTPPELASARVFLAVLRDTLAGASRASDLVLPRVDLSQLFPEPAAAFIAAHGGEIRLQSPVRDLAALRQSFSRIIVAVGPHQLKTLFPDAPDYSYQPIYTCYLQYGEGTRLGFPMIGLASGLVQWVFDRGALLGEKGRLACVISAQGDHQQISLDAIAERCHQEVSAAFGPFPRPAWSRVIAEKRATITCSPGIKEARFSVPGVTLAGDYTDPEYPPTLEAAVRSGVRAAAQLVP